MLAFARICWAIEWSVHVNHIESSLECLNHLITVFAVDVFDAVVAGNNKVSVH